MNTLWCGLYTLRCGLLTLGCGFVNLKVWFVTIELCSVNPKLWFVNPKMWFVIPEMWFVNPDVWCVNIKLCFFVLQVATVKHMASGAMHFNASAGRFEVGPPTQVRYIMLVWNIVPYNVRVVYCVLCYCTCNILHHTVLLVLSVSIEGHDAHTRRSHSGLAVGVYC